MNIEEKLTASIISAIKTLYGQDVPGKMVQLQKTKKEFEGHLTLVVFPFLKMSKKGPEQTAQEIGEYLKKNEPALKEKVDTLIEQGIKDGTLNGLSEKWLKAPLPASLGA